MIVTTSCGTLELADSVRSFKSNTRTIAKTFTQADGTPARLDIELRWDDTCKNGSNSFAITANLLKTQSGYLRTVSGGCLHDEIAEHAPELAFAIPYHLFSAEGPMHYFANTTFLAGDADFNGARKGEQRHNKAGLPLWQNVSKPFDIIAAAEKPAVEGLFEPVLGDGKERELDSARLSACWSDATDAELRVPKAELSKALHFRLPKLMADFKSVIEQLGFVY